MAVKIKTGNALVWIVGIGLAVAVIFGLLYGVTYLTVVVAKGFGYTIPFWPIFGAWILLGFVGNAFRGGSSK